MSSIRIMSDPDKVISRLRNIKPIFGVVFQLFLSGPIRINILYLLHVLYQNFRKITLNNYPVAYHKTFFITL